MGKRKDILKWDLKKKLIYYRYSRGNRLNLNERPYWRQFLAPRCRLRGTLSQYHVYKEECSFYSASRELGSDRCKSVRSILFGRKKKWVSKMSTQGLDYGVIEASPC